MAFGRPTKMCLGVGHAKINVSHPQTPNTQIGVGKVLNLAMVQAFSMVRKVGRTGARSWVHRRRCTGAAGAKIGRRPTIM